MRGKKMENTIEKLYELHIRTAQFPFGKTDKEITTKECALYCSLIEELPKRHKEMFMEYNSFSQERHKQEIKAIYEQAFKTAIKLFIECSKE
jgi:hypothetical protein